MIKSRKGLMLVLSSPSGAGKSTLCRKIIEFDKKIRMSISATTRPKRKSEIDSKDYFFYVLSARKMATSVVLFINFFKIG